MYKSRAFTHTVIGLVLCASAVALGAPTYVWEYGPLDVTSLPSYPGIAISSTDLINGIVPLKNNELAAGWPDNVNGYVPADAQSGCEPLPINVPQPNHPGFHSVTPSQSGAALTDGAMGAHVDSVLADFLFPSGVFQFDLPAPTDIGEIRVFAQNIDGYPNAPYPNGRVWQRYDVYISRDTNADPKNRLFSKLLDRVVTGNIVCAGTGTGDGWNPNVNNGTQVSAIGSTLTRVYDSASPRLAGGVTSIRFVFWAVSNTQTVNWDQWLGMQGCSVDPLDVDLLDGDGYKRAFEASIIKEIDVLPPTETFEVCDNDADDDGDELIDCADPDCAGEPACKSPEFCWNIDNPVDRNAIDDDGDGLANWDDPDCAPTPWPCAPEVCDNVGDDDGNTLVDCDDPDCWADPACAPEICDNKVDDDEDTLIDCADPDCFGDPACQCTHDPVFDVDDDGDVDQTDFAVFQTCFTGAGGEGFENLSIDCQCMDVTGISGAPDRSIASDDYGIFEQCASGPGVSGNDACDDGPF